MLPKIKHPLNTFIIPSTKHEVSVRPYLAKEEKILLTAKETGNSSEILLAVKQIINNCVVHPKKFDIDKLTTFDIEYLFIKLRAISVSNVMHLEFTDTEEQPDDKGNKKTYKFDINLLNVEVAFPEAIENKIRIDEKMGIIMKYLTIDIPASIYDKQDEMDVLFGLVQLCIDKVWDGDELYNFQEQDKGEQMELIESLPHHVLKQLSEFFKNMPKLAYTIEYVNTLGHNRKIKLETLDDFFSLR
jgi:hypothetical protein